MNPYQFALRSPERNVWYYALSELGEGGYGKVWSGVTEWGASVAIKVIKPSSNFVNDFASWNSDQQVHLIGWRHPNIVVTHDQFVSAEGYLVLVMELAQGSLESLVMRGHAFSPKDVCSVGWHVLNALDHLHKFNIVHRDVTLRNVLYFSGGAIKLSDFGISKLGVLPGGYAKTFIGNEIYLPPELLTEQRSSSQSDIYQTGLILLALLTGHHPVPLSLDMNSTYRAILDGVPRQIAEGLVPTYGNLAQIVSVMLRRRTLYRYKSTGEVMEHLRSEYGRQAQWN